MAFLSCPDFDIKSVQRTVKLAFHGADTDILARIVSRMSVCRSACHRNRPNFVSDVLAGILARISELMSVSAQWNSSLSLIHISEPTRPY